MLCEPKLYLRRENSGLTATGIIPHPTGDSSGDSAFRQGTLEPVQNVI